MSDARLRDLERRYASGDMRALEPLAVELLRATAADTLLNATRAGDPVRDMAALLTGREIVARNEAAITQPDPETGQPVYQELHLRTDMDVTPDGYRRDLSAWPTQINILAPGPEFVRGAVHYWGAGGRGYMSNGRATVFDQASKHDWAGGYSFERGAQKSLYEHAGPGPVYEERNSSPRWISSQRWRGRVKRRRMWARYGFLKDSIIQSNGLINFRWEPVVAGNASLFYEGPWSQRDIGSGDERFFSSGGAWQVAPMPVANLSRWHDFYEDGRPWTYDNSEYWLERAKGERSSPWTGITDRVTPERALEFVRRGLAAGAIPHEPIPDAAWSARQLRDWIGARERDLKAIFWADLWAAGLISDGVR